MGGGGERASVSSQRREDPPVGLSLQQEGRGEKTLAALAMLRPRRTVMAAPPTGSGCFTLMSRPGLSTEYLPAVTHD